MKERSWDSEQRISSYQNAAALLSPDINAARRLSRSDLLCPRHTLTRSDLLCPERLIY